MKDASYRLVSVGELAKEKNLYEDYDDVYDCHVLDEDALIQEMKGDMESPDGGVIVEYHGADLFPSSWFDAVYVLRTDNTILHERLTSRGYSEKKVTENVECEIFQVILDEVMESFDRDIVTEFPSNSQGDQEKNTKMIRLFIEEMEKDGYKKIPEETERRTKKRINPSCRKEKEEGDKVEEIEHLSPLPSPKKKKKKDHNITNASSTLKKEKEEKVNHSKLGNTNTLPTSVRKDQKKKHPPQPSSKVTQSPTGRKKRRNRR